jgi:hypothetical protein
MKKDLREKAINLRVSEGLPITAIAKILNVSKSSVASWTKDILLSENQLKVFHSNRSAAAKKASLKNKNSAAFKRLLEQNKGALKAQEKDQLHLMGCMLYWGEGSKGKNTVRLINTDPNLLRIFIKFLRDCYDVPDVKIKVSCYFYNDLKNKTEVENFWLEVLNLPKDCLYKSTEKTAVTIKNRRREYGMCSIAVNNTAIVQNILGAIQEYSGQKNLDWV